MINTAFSDWLVHPITKLLTYQLNIDLDCANECLINVNSISKDIDKTLYIGELIGAIKTVKQILSIQADYIEDLAKDYNHEYPDNTDIIDLVHSEEK